MKTKIFILRISILLFFCFLVSCNESMKDRFNVQQFGAVGDGKTFNTKFLNQAIKSCSENGGGTVYVPPGTYISGPISMHSNVTLYLEVGATIKGSCDINDYPLDPTEMSVASNRVGLITARNKRNISIAGHGIIDGSAMAFMHYNKLKTGGHHQKKYTRQKEDYMNPKYGTQDTVFKHGQRPGNMILFDNCENILIRGVTIQNSPTWTIQINNCKNVDIIEADINSFGSNLRMPNDDGINIRDSQFVHVCECDIQTGDDCISVIGCKNLIVGDCTLSSKSAAVRVGFAGADTKNCIFNDLVIHTSNRGLLVNVRGSGSVENIQFSDIIIQTQLFTGGWWGNAEPIHISAMPWDKKAEKLGKIKTIRFSNIIAEGESGILIYGCPQSVIKDITFDNLKFRINNSELNKGYGGNFDLRSTDNMATSLFEHDISGMYCKYVDGLKIKDFEFQWQSGLPDFFNHAIQCEYINDLVIEGFKGRGAHPDDTRAAIDLNNVNTVSIQNSVARQGTNVFLKHRNLTNPKFFTFNDLSLTQKVFEPEQPEFEMSGNIMPSGN